MKPIRIFASTRLFGGGSAEFCTELNTRTKAGRTARLWLELSLHARLVSYLKRLDRAQHYGNYKNVRDMSQGETVGRFS